LGKIKVVADPEIDALFPGVKRARARITTNEGWVYGAQVDHAKGSPENPMSDEEIVSKFRANAEGVVSPSRQDQIIAATWDFDKIGDLSRYMQLFIAEK
jgi:2-methylcitrate dehydratase